jgi:hypothetical protein
MRSARLVIGVLVATLVGVGGWRSVWTRTGDFRQTGQRPSEQQSTLRRVGLSPAPGPQQVGPPVARAQKGETEKQLGPFSFGGRNYVVVLRERKVQPGAAGETGDTVVSMEIRDAAGTALFRRTFPYQTKNEEFSDSWSVWAKPLIGTHGSGLLVSYGFDSEPSAPEPESTGSWQVFGVVGGKFKPFGAPLTVQGGLLPNPSTANIYLDKEIKTAGGLDEHSDLLEFKVWARRFRLIFPIRVNWAQGRLAPVVPCQKGAQGARPDACRYKVVPEDDRHTAELTFVRLCPNPTKCEKPEKVVVKGDSKVEFPASRVIVEWTDGNAAGPSANSKDPMNDAGGIVVSPDSETWLDVRVDGKEGWINSEEDFNALGMPFEQ